eukprot:4568261-Amphidinium_carterae.2
MEKAQYSALQAQPQRKVHLIHGAIKAGILAARALDMPKNLPTEVVSNLLAQYTAVGLTERQLQHVHCGNVWLPSASMTSVIRLDGLFFKKIMRGLPRGSMSLETSCFTGSVVEHGGARRPVATPGALAV